MKKLEKITQKYPKLKKWWKKCKKNQKVRKMPQNSQKIENQARQKILIKENTRKTLKGWVKNKVWVGKASSGWFFTVFHDFPDLEITRLKFSEIFFWGWNFALNSKKNLVFCHPTRIYDITALFFRFPARFFSFLTLTAKSLIGFRFFSAKKM